MTDFDLELRRPSGSLVPANMREAIELANLMSKGRLVPAALQDKPSDCLLVIEVAMRWRMSPFAVAQEVSVPGGKLMFSGKIVAAALQSSGHMLGRLDYEYTGEGDDRTVTVSGAVKGVGRKEVRVRLGDVRTDNKQWRQQPDQQLAYSGSRTWGRRWLPEVLLGVSSPEEDYEDEAPPPPRDVENTFADPEPEPVTASPGSMREVAAEVMGRPVVEPEGEPIGDSDGLPLIYADGKPRSITRGLQSGASAATVWTRAVQVQLAQLEDRQAVHAWRAANGPLFGSIAQLYPEAVRDAERLIDGRLAAFPVDNLQP